MSDLIERQAAIEALAEMYCKCDEDGYVWIIRGDAWKRIDALPSALPERCEDCVNFSKTRLLIPQPEIIRCKDCTWFDSPRVCLRHGRFVENSNWFCADGERRRGWEWLKE